MTFGNFEIDGLNVQACLAMAIVGLVVLISLLKFSGNSLPGGDSYGDQLSQIRAATGEEMIDILKDNNLWELGDSKGVSPVVFSSYPDNIDQLDTLERKRLFFHSLLPVALVALSEVRKEKEALRAILHRFPDGYTQLVFSDDYGVWGRVLTMDEIEFILMLTRKYRSNRALELVKRVETVPLSLIMAQGAMESSWGSSRFARQGNNLFGIWTWGEKGIVPSGRDDGKSHKIAIYDSILDSVRAYVTMLNRLPAYRHFRELRSKSMNSLNLADGLLYYSERRNSYVWEIKDLIKHNKLWRYDDLSLLETPPIFHRMINALNISPPSTNGSA